MKPLVVLLLLFCSCQLSAQDTEPGENSKLINQLPPITETEEMSSKWNLDFEVTFVSRFIWRGLRLGEYTSIQPSFTLSRANFFTGIWASHALALTVPANSTPNDYKEIVPYVGYSFKVAPKSSLTLLALGHYNPNVGGFFNYTREGEAIPLTNRVELRTLFNAGKFDFVGAADVINDPSGNVSIYLEFGYTITMPREVKLRPVVSLTPSDNFYTIDGKADVTQIGVITSKAFSFTDKLSLAAKVDMIYNPDRDDFYSAFGLTAKF
ncbi:MAG: hypothetical protein AAGF89_01110 [Bacteroidota bacterium]